MYQSKLKNVYEKKIENLLIENINFYVSFIYFVLAYNRAKISKQCELEMLKPLNFSARPGP